ncbi:Endodeoxyribonuclease RusA [Sulfobacillus thermosulfidooxidans DSM 9293]|uniref:Endodeoxyribonuclease RusA n=1 Tax=Sulfobacillus thermosulfidooxidans (strain DSM 9293 / VKM B-1269 / AT-1) TaxID=929705 RepID=A0A1W1W6Z2_SULTA|nr:RusA family crossover junction endodeoxyribonuclease [Sulfobacillus thermosulfidooxidans]SMC01972.1 Endodeoxyribonuclease RusA [Sulfobacillus thermosulfidooxidans DSM 9293]
MSALVPWPPLILTIPPSDNHAHRIARVHGHPRMILTTAARTWRTEAQWTMKIWQRTTGWTVPARGQKVIAALMIWWPDHRTHDPGNLIKEVADAMKGVLIVDDQWLLPRVMDFGWDRQHPRIAITLTVMGSNAAQKIES